MVLSNKTDARPSLPNRMIQGLEIQLRKKKKNKKTVPQVILILSCHDSMPEMCFSKFRMHRNLLGTLLKIQNGGAES